jgi:hypothetical protein
MVPRDLRAIRSMNVGEVGTRDRRVVVEVRSEGLVADGDFDSVVMLLEGDVGLVSSECESSNRQHEEERHAGRKNPPKKHER